MAHFSNEEYADMHLIYGEVQCNAREAERRYAEKFPNRRHPTRATFVAVHQRLRESGSVVPKNTETGRRPDVTMGYEDDILIEIDNNPEVSTRRLAAMYPGISKSSIWNIIQKENLHPFHFQKVHGMIDCDFPARVDFSNWLRNKINQNPNFFSNILFCDEATFTRDGIFNLHNAHHYAYIGDNPHAIVEKKHQQRFKINVWIGLIGDQLLGPVELPTRLTGQEYLNFLQNVLPDLMDDVPLMIRNNLWFMHDGCPAHFSRDVRQFLDDNYGDKWIGRGGPVNWPTRSPDLNPCDFCIWGYLKSLVYGVTIGTRNQLWQRIQNACNEIRNKAGIFPKIRRSLEKRIDLCIETNGRHVEHLL